MQRRHVCSCMRMEENWSQGDVEVIGRVKGRFRIGRELVLKNVQMGGDNELVDCGHPMHGEI